MCPVLDTGNCGFPADSLSVLLPRRLTAASGHNYQPTPIDHAAGPQRDVGHDRRRLGPATNPARLDRAGSTPPRSVEPHLETLFRRS
jgi:hypothetical protein